MVIKNPDTILLPLRDGERLQADEFFRRYEAMPNCKKAELINGVVYIGSPVTAIHSSSCGGFAFLLRYYAGFTPGVWNYGNGTVMLGDDDQPQPDHTLRILDGGSSHLSERSYIVGPPELVAEISFTSLRNDVGVRREMFQRHDVHEYLVWRVEEQVFTWWRLLDGEYVDIEADAEGVMRSVVFPGSWLDTRAMIGDDVPGILSTLNDGLASPEHADFVRRLRLT